MEIKSEDIGIKFYFDESDESYGSVTLRVCAPEEELRIDGLVNKPIRKFKGGKFHEYTETNSKLFYKLLWDYCIVDWENVTQHQKELECNKENKNKVMMGNAAFSTFVQKHITDMKEELEEGKGLVKN